ncbi:MAG: tyrosine--tRNA ligase [bacterium]
MKYDIEKQLELISRGADEIIPKNELLEKLKKGRPLRIKFGADPTAPDLHLGHMVVLRKLRTFQELGHKVIFLIGDFTGMIGDPSGRSDTRNAMTKEEVKRNAKTYEKQMFKILDPKKTEVVFNSDWLSKMTLEDTIKLSSVYTVARMLERDDFQKRYAAQVDISVLEFMYPLLQGYDSVHLNSDIEVGGTDQKFNLLLGRTVQKRYGKAEQVVITMPILEGTDGKLKMSKSYGNYIGLTEPAKEIFGKIMSIPDELMIKYYTLLTDIPLEEIREMGRGLDAGKIHPKDAKVRLGKYLVGVLHSQKAADEAALEFDVVFKNKELPTDMPLFKIGVDVQEPDGMVILGKILVHTKLCQSFGDAKRKIVQNGVKVDSIVVNDPNMKLDITAEKVVQVGKRNFARIIKK